MGTQQQLTTEQVNLLILISEFEECAMKQKEEVDDVMPIDIMITQDNLVELEDFSRIAEVLHYYGYIGRDYSITMDGKQYLELFKEYLQQKEKYPTVAFNNQFNLVNIEVLSNMLNANIGKEGISGVIGEFAKLCKNVGQMIKGTIQK